MRMEMKDMRQAELFMDFVKRSPTAFHAADQVARMLEEAGYERRMEQEKWEIRPGGRYYVTRNHL